MDELNPRHRQFVDEYLCCWNARAAARKVGYHELYSVKLMARPDVQAAISEALTEHAMSPEETLARLADRARGVPPQVWTRAGPSMQAIIDEGKTHLIKRYTRTPASTNIEFIDSGHDLELIGKHHKLFTDRNQIDVDQATIEGLDAALKRIYGGRKEDTGN